MIDSSRPTGHKRRFSGPRRAIVSSVYTESYYPLALALGYSLTQTNNLQSQNAEMVLFIRKGANVTSPALNKLRKIGWKLRIEDDLELHGVDIEQIRPWHRWNFNKLRFWSWTEYEQILFLDADTLVKGDVSDIWDTPGGNSLTAVQS